MSDEVDEARLRATTDAAVWATEFMKVVAANDGEVDRMLMIAWFANAMETARTITIGNLTQGHTYGWPETRVSGGH